MLTLLLWWLGIILECVVLLRMGVNHVYRVYPSFFVYLACVMVSSASGYAVYRFRPTMYPAWYWTGDFVCVLAGYAVVLEILEKALAGYDGPRKLARRVGLLVFVSVVGFTTAQWVMHRGLPSIRSSIEVERDLRLSELALLAFAIVVVSYYGIQIGRNLRGIVLGYGLYVGVVVMDYAARSYLGESFHKVFSVAGGYSYLAALFIWAAALWASHPNPVPKRSAPGDLDYELLAAETRDAVESVRGRLGKVAGR